MAQPKTYLTASIVFACFSLIALFAGLALPSIEHSNLRNQIQADNILTRETSRSWGEVPGTRNITYQKSFTVYDLDGATDQQILSGQVNVKESLTALYDYTYTFKDLQFAPASNSSVQYHKMYSHTYQGPDENVLKTTTVKTLNIGALKGMVQQADMSRAQVFVQSLFKLYESFQQNIVSLIITDYVYNFYIHNKTLTYSTVFLYQNTFSQELADQLWDDPSYGWKESLTLVPWINIVQGYIYTIGYDPTTNPNYPLLKAHFQLTDDQMMYLINASSPGQVASSSILYLASVAVTSTMSGNFGCMSPRSCNQTETFSLQFFSASITKNPIFEGIPARDSVSELNQTFAVPPEIASVMKGQNVDFRSDLQSALFGLNGDSTGPLPGQQSLFSITNVEFIIQNQNSTQAVQSWFNLDNVQQAQVLIDYVNYIVDQFAYQGQGDTLLKAYKYMADVTASSMNRLQNDLANLLLVNVTAIGTYSAMTQGGFNCSSILIQDIKASQDVINSICNNPDLTLDTPQGQAPWISAYYNGPGSSIYTYIETTTGIADADLQTLLATTSKFGGFIQAVVGAISTALECGTGPCLASYVSQLQWTTSNYTMKLPPQYFTKTYESVAEIFPDYFGSFIPEFPVYAKNVLQQTVDIPAELGGALFSYDTGSINNNFEVLSLFLLANNKNSTAIQDRFKFDTTTLNAILSYFDSTLMNYYMGGLTQTISIYDLLWGYQDPFLTKLTTATFFETVQVFYPKVSIFGDKDNLATYADQNYDMINSGADNADNVRIVSQYNGNSTLSVTGTLYDGVSYVAQPITPWAGDAQYINGTDGSGFQSLLDKSEPITLFEDKFLRNLDLKFDSEFTYGSEDYDFYRYKLDTQQLAVSDTFHNIWDGYMNLTSVNDTPILVSSPYFKDCDNTSYSKVTFDGKSAADLQDGVEPVTFVVESITGITANYSKSYQYSIFNGIPYLLTNPNTFSAIPLLIINETFVTPDSAFDGDMKDYYKKSHEITVFMIVSLSLAFVMLVIAGVMLRFYLKNKKYSVISHLQESPGHDYQSLQVDSVGGYGTYNSVGNN